MRKVLMKMKFYSCEIHIEQVLEDFIEKEEKFPLMEIIQEDEKLSTSCSQCDQPALYVVANE